MSDLDPLFERVGLGLDTSGDVCSIAISRGRTLLSEYRFTHRMHLSERMLDDLVRLLESCDLTLKEVDYFAVGIGPGSFTGTRVAVTTVKMLADTLQKPVYGVNSLGAIASDYFGVASVVAPLTLCRKRDVYFALYHAAEKAIQVLESENEFQTQVSPQIISLDELPTLLQTAGISDILFTGDAQALLTPEDRTALGANNVLFRIAKRSVSLASQALSLAQTRILKGDRGDDPVLLTPLYLALPPISQPKIPYVTLPNAQQLGAD